MTERSFNCPRTSAPCTNAGCTVMHCETQAAHRRATPAPRPPLRLPSGFLPWDSVAGSASGPLTRLTPVHVAYRSGDRSDEPSMVSGYSWQLGDDHYAIIGYQQVQVPPSGDGWVPWDGGVECPIPGARMSLQSRNGRIYHEVNADLRRWSHRNDASDIVAYRVTRAVPLQGPVAIPDGWIRVPDGVSTCPVPVTSRVRWTMQNGITSEDYRLAGSLSWSRDIDGPTIIAYLPEGVARTPEALPVAETQPPLRELAALPLFLANEMTGLMSQQILDALPASQRAAFSLWLTRHRAAYAIAEGDHT